MSSLFWANVESFFRGVGDGIKNTVEFSKEMSEELGDAVDELKTDVRNAGREFVVDTASEINYELGEKASQYYKNKDNFDATLNNLLGGIPGKKISSINDLDRGDHICISCFMGLFSHHAIYKGNSEIIHYCDSDENDEAFEVCVRLDDISALGEGVDIYLLSERESRTRYSRDSIVRRAISKLNEENYNLLFNNCESFARWCRNGDWDDNL